MINQTCCFTGHRDIAESEMIFVEKSVRENILTLISNGVNTFYCGGAIGFDMLCGKIIIDLKESFPSLRLFLALPCPSQNKYYTKSQNEDYKYLIENSDNIYYASDHYHAGCMHDRNRYMVNLSEYIICFCKKSSGGTFSTVKYAVGKGKKIISI